MIIIKDVISIASAIILSVGGSGAIIIALSKWFGQIFASKLLENDRRKYSLEMEELKHQYTKEINLINANIDKSTHVTKQQYDKEFSIYLEIWEALGTAIISTQNLYPFMDTNIKKDEHYEQILNDRFNQFIIGFNNYSNAITKYAPFYEERFYNQFIELRKLFTQQASWFQIYALDVPDDSRKEVYRDNPRKMVELEESLQKQIREHLKSLQHFEE